MFLGTSLLNLDAKGRISIPTKYRDALSLQCEGRGLILTRHPDDCLLLMPRPTWEKDFLPQINELERRIKRIFLSFAEPIEMDASGRILISPELRAEACLSREVRLGGMDTYFELWDPKKYKESEKQGLESEAMSETMNNLKF